MFANKAILQFPAVQFMCSKCEKERCSQYTNPFSEQILPGSIPDWNESMYVRIDITPLIIVVDNHYKNTE